MTLGLGVLLSLFLLAPGLAFHAALFPIHGSKGMRFAVPPPGSVLALSVIGFGSLVAHTGWALMSAAIRWACDSGTPCVRVPFEPNIYASMLRVGEHSPAVSSADVTVALVSMLLLSALAYATYPLLGQSARIRRLRYGWLSDFVEQAAKKNHYTTAFVLTSVEHDGSFLGYDGLVENLSLNSDKEITAITLTRVNRFVVRIGKSDVYRNDVDRNPIARLYVERRTSGMSP